MPLIPRLSFDIDGVLADFTTTFTVTLNKHGNTNHHKDWNEYNAFGEGKTFSQEAWDKSWAETKQVKDFWFNLNPLPNIDFSSINQRMGAGEFNGYFITHRKSMGKGDFHGDPNLETRNWLYRYGVREYSAVIAGVFNRAELLKQLSADAHIDDWGKQYLELKEAGVNCFLIDRTYNQDIDAGEDRVYSVEEYITKAIARIKR